MGEDLYEKRNSNYCYKDSNVLINKLDIHDEKLLQKYEARITAAKLLALRQKGIIGSQIKNLITKGKDLILSNVSSNLKNEINLQEKSFSDIEENIANFNNFYNNKDFEGMTKEYNKIQSELKKLFPLENVLNETKRIDILYNLIKNNGHNFNLNENEISFIQKMNI